jgi:hypothetical protein
MEGYARPAFASMGCILSFAIILKWPTAEAAAVSEV